MGDNEGEATITKKGPFGYTNDREQYVIYIKDLKTIIAQSDTPGSAPLEFVKNSLSNYTKVEESYYTYDLKESQTKSFGGLVTNDVILVKTSDPAVKQHISEKLGATFQFKIEQLVMIDGKAVPAKDLAVPGGFEVSEVNGKIPTRDSVTYKIHSLEGGYKYREGVNFTVEEKAGSFFVVPKLSEESGRDLYNLMRGQNIAALTVSPPVIAQLEAPKKKGEKQAVA